MLTVITSEQEGGDYVEDFLASPEYAAMQADIRKSIEEDGRDPSKKIVYDSVYAALFLTRMKLLIQRVRRIYWRR